MSKTITVRLDEELLARVNARYGKGERNAALVRLIERDLGTAPAKVAQSRSQISKAPPKRDEKPDPLAGIPERWVEDARMFLSIVSPRPISPKRAREALGWTEGRFERVEATLMNSRQVVVVDGLLHASPFYLG